jgi:cation diffusion facilitator CzcD-associated flavoprotein CzcO
MNGTGAAEVVGTAIVGAGFGGLAMAGALDAAGRGDFLVLEKADRVGGTWRENTYPGAACDVPSHLYSLSNQPNPHWSRLFPRQGEIQAHLERSAAALVDSGRVRFGWRLVAAHWDEAAALWRLQAADGRSVSARFLVLALGPLHRPAWPDLPGLESFAGIAFHSAQWRHDLDLAGRRVAVIGTGASAIQFIPEVAREAAKLTVFQRTPPWLLPRPDVALPAWLGRLFEGLPLLRLLLRGVIFLWLEMLASALTHRRTAFWAEGLARWHLRRQVPDPALRAALTPDYPIGCKRVLLASDYYPALQRPNVDLLTTPIAAVEPAGVRLADGRLVAADVLIHGTGFRPLDLLADVDVRGTGGESLAARWSGRPQAHLGITVPGFPNLGLLLGPNTALGHNSVLYMIESQVRHLVRLQALADHQSARAVEPQEAALAAWQEEVDQRFPDSAWAGGCKSWYLDGAGRNIALWTASCMAYRWRVARPRVAEYRVLG